MSNEYENIDLFELQREASVMRAQYLSKMMSDLKAWIKSHFTFGAVTHV
jgi:hypothetical protein